MKTIYKYPLNAVETVIRVPGGARLLTIQIQGETPHVWVLVDTDATRRITMVLTIYGTGHELPSQPGEYVGTWQSRGFVWHVFLSWRD